MQNTHEQLNFHTLYLGSKTDGRSKLRHSSPSQLSQGSKHYQVLSDMTRKMNQSMLLIVLRIIQGFWEIVVAVRSNIRFDLPMKIVMKFTCLSVRLTSYHSQHFVKQRARIGENSTLFLCPEFILRQKKLKKVKSQWHLKSI